MKLSELCMILGATMILIGFSRLSIVRWVGCVVAIFGLIAFVSNH